MYCTLYSIIRQGHKSRQEKGESRKWGGGGGRTVDPHSFFAELDPAVFPNANSDPAAF